MGQDGTTEFSEQGAVAVASGGVTGGATTTYESVALLLDGSCKGDVVDEDHSDSSSDSEEKRDPTPGRTERSPTVVVRDEHSSSDSDDDSLLDSSDSSVPFSTVLLSSTEKEGDKGEECQDESSGADKSTQSGEWKTVEF